MGLGEIWVNFGIWHRKSRFDERHQTLWVSQPVGRSHVAAMLIFHTQTVNRTPESLLNRFEADAGPIEDESHKLPF